MNSYRIFVRHGNDKIMNRIYHPYWNWEDHEHGFYDNCSGKEKERLLLEVVSLFSDQQRTREAMLYVVGHWKNSMEHNLSNQQMNQIAYIGQAACCYAVKAPSTITMEAWSLVPKEHQIKADQIALELLTKWQSENGEI